MPRDHWLTDDEKHKIRLFARAHPLEGYRRMTFTMFDAVAESLHRLFELANPVLLRTDYGEQRLDQRRSLLYWNVRKCRESLRHP